MKLFDIYVVTNLVDKKSFYVLAVKLPELLMYANIEDETLMELQQKLVDFLKYDLSSETLNCV